MVLQANSSIELDHPVEFLLDSGAVISAVHYDALPVNLRIRMESYSMVMVGANGLPLDVAGEITATLTVVSFSDVHTLITVRNLIVDWLLGANFLAKHRAVIDYQEKQLLLGMSTIHLDSYSRTHLEDKAVRFWFRRQWRFLEGK